MGGGTPAQTLPLTSGLLDGVILNSLQAVKDSARIGRSLTF